MRKLSFRVRKKYFVDMKNHDKNVEYRSDVSFWRIRVENLVKACGVKLGKDHYVFPLPSGAQAVILNGKTREVWRREIITIQLISTPGWFSDQGKADVDTPECWAFSLGSDMDEQGRIL